ncbi:hypothetical protein IU459_06035 [Nocardia amamiensis]|uniref:Uncharacterized protein n=1 Tax=Nocardia amamiensis TaxID=404578 RepID=A0ABS0CKF7_9NOCA|nr:hypothetical protein [Nocardia amamiensis]MBF6297102.1 hypothetical protein [Nocardia amamiensis]
MSAPKDVTNKDVAKDANPFPIDIEEPESMSWQEMYDLGQRIDSSQVAQAAPGWGAMADRAYPAARTRRVRRGISCTLERLLSAPAAPAAAIPAAQAGAGIPQASASGSQWVVPGVTASVQSEDVVRQSALSADVTAV